ncbi:MAG: lipoate--protein ligase family protein [Gemmatimonas sp.]
MAVDLTLMREARRQGTGFLRLYGWERPTVSFGRHEETEGIATADRLERAGFDVTRRPTGGRALLHCREVTYAVAIPIEDRVRWSAAYGAVNQHLLLALQSLGVPARIVDPSPSANGAGATPMPPHQAAAACFSGIAPGEIAVGNRKLVASSVWRERGAYLQHGSILIQDDQALLDRVISGTGKLTEPAAVLTEFLTGGEHSVASMTSDALFAAFGECGNGAPWSIPPEVLSEVARVRTELAQPAWLWRR